MKKGLVSIITPCFNGGQFISETIESVVAQTYSNWELLIVDDGSKDNSKDIIDEYVKIDKRIHYYYQENSGSAAARNYGIRKAQGQYIALLDADDLWLPTFLEKQVNFCIKNDAICVYCSYSRIDDNSNTIMRPTIAKSIITTRDMRVMNQIGCLTGIYNIEKYGKIYLKEDLKSIRDDYAYWYDVVALDNKAYGNPEILAKYRVLDNSTTGNKKKLIRKQFQFYRSYLNESVVEALCNTMRWGVAGLRKFRR